MSRRVASTAVNAVFRVLETLLLVAMLVLAARFALQFAPRAPWVTQSPVSLLRKIDPALAMASSAAGLAGVRSVAWPGAGRSFLPLALAVGVWIVRLVVASTRESVVGALDRRPQRAAAPPDPAPAPRAAAAVAVPVTEPNPVPAPAAAPPPVAPKPAAPKPVAPKPAAPAAPSPAPAQKAPAATSKPGLPAIGRYEMLAELGRGAMGVVYKARDPRIGRTVAIKTILAANLSAESLEKYKRRFMVEAQSAGKLVHPAIVAVHDVAEDSAGQPCLVIEYVEGIGLDRWMSGERPPLEKVLPLLVEVAEGLEHAHAHGVVHRDVKPANILITKEGHAKISDFGIAKLAGVTLTSTGQLVGTPAFMSPEQFTGAAVDARSDVFSFGAMGYLLCTGEKAFPAETVTALSFKVVHVEPVPARQIDPGLPADLDAVLMKCLAKKPEQRYQTCAEIAEDLRKVAAGLSRKAS